MMRKFETLGYLDGGTFQDVAIPYQGTALVMVVLLPKKTDGLAALEKALTSANLTKWIASLKPHDVDLKLPKFKITSRFEMAKALSDMGMPVAFSDKADFSGMTSETKLMISNVIHQAFVDVHEKGTEAAAATAVIAADPVSASEFPKATFHADHRFVFLIYEGQTATLLFMGRLNDPTAKSG
jgi:serpin B